MITFFKNAVLFCLSLLALSLPANAASEVLGNLESETSAPLRLQELSSIKQQEQSSMKQSVANPAAASNWKVSGATLVESDKYQDPIPGNSLLDQSLLASVHLRTEYSGARATGAADLKFSKYLDWGGSQAGVRELYTAIPFGPSDRQSVSLGRRIQFWSEVDQDWQLGLWQPLTVIDTLRPDDQGLTGLFYQYHEENINLLVLGTPLHIPTLRPELKEVNGNIVTNNRWYNTPSNSFMLFGQSRKVIYSVSVPSTSELTQKPGAGLRLRLGKDKEGAWVSANAGYKAMNNLLVKYSKKLSLVEVGADNGSVPLTGAVGYHSIYGADLGYQFPVGRISISYLEDHPVDLSSEEGSILQNPRPMRASAAHSEGNFSLFGFEQPVTLAVDYLRILGGDIRDYDSFGNDRGAVFSQRFIFTHAASVRGEISTAILGKKLTSALKYLREFDQKGQMINGEIHLFATRSLALLAGADLLGPDDSSEANMDSRFLNQYRANDRIYGGFSYVF